MNKVDRLRKDLANIRTELEFIDGQLDNDAILGGDMGLGELSDGERNKLMAANEKLVTEVIILETLLEEPSVRS